MPCEPSEPFDGESSRAWAIKSRDEPPVLPGSQDYQVAKESLRLEREKFDTAIARSSGSDDTVIQEIVSRYSRLAWTLSPIRRLPDELLGLIFELATDDVIFGDQTNLLKVRLACMRWNKVALGHGELWSYIEMPTEPAVKRLPPQELLQNWLIRSKQSSLSVVLSSTWVEHIEAEDDLYLLPLVKDFHRWGALGTNGDRAWRYLTRLLAMVGSSPPPGSATPPEATIVIPNLTSLWFNNDVVLGDFAIRAQTLSHLHLRHTRLSDREYILLAKSFPDIEQMHLEDITWSLPIDATAISDNISHPKLRDLMFDVQVDSSDHFPRSDLLAGILQAIIQKSPRLTTIEITSSFVTSQSLWSTGTLRWNQAFPGIKWLRVFSDRRNWNIRPAQLLEHTAQLSQFINCFPSIWYLEIGFLQAHTPAPSSNDVHEFSSNLMTCLEKMDRLRELSLSNVPMTPLGFERLAKTLERNLTKFDKPGGRGPELYLNNLNLVRPPSSPGDEPVEDSGKLVDEFEEVRELMGAVAPNLRVVRYP